MSGYALDTKTVLSSAARTASANSDRQDSNGCGVTVFLDVTATPNNTETLTLAVEGYDPASQKWVPLTAFTALTASDIGATSSTDTYAYTVYPGAVETAAAASHEVQGLPLPRWYRVAATHSSTGSWTYSVSIAELA